MKKYVLPPKFSWINHNVSLEKALLAAHMDASSPNFSAPADNPAMAPMVMYIFEFEHAFNEKDMKNMWHNLSPTSLLSIKEPKTSEITISHELSPIELFGPTSLEQMGEGKKTTISQDTQWMVFKIKQRAKTDYASVSPNTTLDATDDSQKLRFGYNWPYDYFSMVELVKIEEELEFNDGGG